MSSIPYFRSAFQSNVKPNSISASQPPSSGKRKRHVSDLHEHSPDGQTEDVTDRQDIVSEAGTWEPVHDTVIASDYESPANSSSRPLDSGGSAAQESSRKAKVARQFAALQPPLTGPFRRESKAPLTYASKKRGLRQQHHEVLVAIMHRSLLDGDSQRAGRAWGMLMRAETSSHSFDPCTGSRWGLGAEIHMQQSIQQRHSISDQLTDSEAIKCSAHNLAILLGSEGFAKAKRYYERLIIQHPYQKALPFATNAMDFYLAMFDFWLRFIIDQQSIAEQDYLEGSPSTDNVDIVEEQHGADGTPILTEDCRGQLEKEKIRDNILRRVQELADRLNSLLSSPPYSDQASFWSMSAMVAQWIADLSLQTRLSAASNGVRKTSPV